MKPLMFLALILQIAGSILLLESRSKSWRKLSLSLGILVTAAISLLLSTCCGSQKRVDPDENVDYGPPPDHEETGFYLTPDYNPDIESLIAYGPPEMLDPPARPKEKPVEPATPDSLKPSTQTDSPPEVPDPDICYGPPPGP